MSQEFKCPHCSKVIKEVSVVEILWRRILISAGLGIGCGLLIYPLVAGDKIVAVVGAFIVGSVITFLVTKVSAKKKFQ